MPPILVLSPTSSSSSSSNSLVVAVDATTGTRTWSVTPEGNSSTELACAVVYCPPTHFLASVKGKATTLCLAFQKETPLGRFASPEQIEILAVTHDGVHCVGGGVSGTVFVWDNLTGTLLTAFKAHYRAITTLTFSFDSSVLVSSSQDGAIHAWDFCTIATQQRGHSPISTIASHRMDVTGVALLQSHGGRLLVTSCSRDHTCRVTDIYTAKEVALASFSCALLSLVIFGSTIFVGDIEGRIHAIDAKTGTKSTLNSKHDRDVTGLVVLDPTINSLGLEPPTTSSKNIMLISSSLDGSLMWTDLTTRRPVRAMKGIDGTGGIKYMALAHVRMTTTTSFSPPPSSSSSSSNTRNNAPSSSSSENHNMKKLKQEAVILSKFKDEIPRPSRVPIPNLWRNIEVCGGSTRQFDSFCGISDIPQQQDHHPDNDAKVWGDGDMIPMKTRTTTTSDETQDWRAAATDLYHLVCRDVMNMAPKPDEADPVFVGFATRQHKR